MNRMTTTVCRPADKMPATSQSGWHYDATTFPVGQHKAWEQPGQLADVYARHTGFFALDVDAYKPEAAEGWEHSATRKVLGPRAHTPYVTRGTEGSRRYLVAVTPEQASEWWPVAGRTVWGEIRSSGLAPSPGAVHPSGDLYTRGAGPDTLTYPDGTTVLTSVIQMTAEVRTALEADGATGHDDRGNGAVLEVELPDDDGRECPVARDWFEAQDFSGATPDGRGERHHGALVYLKNKAHEGHFVAGILAEVQATGANMARWGSIPVDPHKRGIAPNSDCCGHVPSYLRNHHPSGQASQAHMPQNALESTLSDFDLWGSLPFLQHVQNAAHARMLSPEAVLLAALARLSGVVAPWYVRVDIGLGEIPLTVFAAILGPSSAGKSMAADCARDILPLPGVRVLDGTRDGVAPGSGEGLAHMYYGKKEIPREPGSTGGRPMKVFEQVRNHALMYADEGEVVAQLCNRRGSTLGPALRAAWSGRQLGNANVSDNTVTVERYALGFVAAFQPGILADLLAGGDAGTPQRFLYADAVDASIPWLLPAHPGMYKLPQMPDMPHMALGPVGTTYTPHFVMDAAPEIRQEVLDHRHAVQTGRTTVDDLDGKAYEYRARIAALLALTDGRRAIDTELWEIAGVIWARSCAVRDAYAEVSKARQAESEREYAGKLAARKVAEVDAVAKYSAHDRVVDKMLGWLAEDPTLTDGALWRNLTGRDRKLVDREAVLADARG